MDSGTIGIIIGIAGIIATIIIGSNKFIIKNSGNVKNIKNSNVTISDNNIGKDNKIIKGDKDVDK